MGDIVNFHGGTSLSARRAWIEIVDILDILIAGMVALREEGVDRNSLDTVRTAFPLVALREEGVDRNPVWRAGQSSVWGVALREEGVDRNMQYQRVS